MLKKECIIRYGYIDIPVFIYHESRRSYRASFVKKGLAIRIPKAYPDNKKSKLENDMLQWAKQTIQKKPSLLEKYRKKRYENGSNIALFDKTYSLQIKYKDRKSIGGRVRGQQIIIELPTGSDSSIIEAKHIAKVFSKHYKQFFENRLNYWSQVFPIEYKQLRLKYNHSNWGSCSTKRNINLSTRLLLCPLPVIDYVIVHELAHLIQPNHSKQFWAEVAHVMPDWKQHAKWLKKDGAYLDF